MMNCTMNCTTLLVEDHPLMRKTLSDFVTQMEDVELIGAVASGGEAIQFCREHSPHLALIDVSLPAISGLELVRELRALRPDLICLMLSAHQEITYIRRALANGAQGYVVKGNPTELEEAIRQVIQGKIFLSQTVRDKLYAAEMTGE